MKSVDFTREMLRKLLKYNDFMKFIHIPLTTIARKGTPAPPGGRWAGLPIFPAAGGQPLVSGEPQNPAIATASAPAGLRAAPAVSVAARQIALAISAASVTGPGTAQLANSPCASSA